MDIKEREKTEKSIQKDDKKNELEQIRPQDIKPGDNNSVPKGEVHNEASKKHGDKDEQSNKSHKIKGQGAVNEPDSVEEDYQDTYGPTEFMDPQDLEDSDPDFLDQPQSMSDDLSSIYPGRASSREERQALARERADIRNRQNDDRRKNLGQSGQDAFDERRERPRWNEGHRSDRRYLDTERGNYGRHNDYQDRQGYERNRNLEDEYPSDERNRYAYGPDRYERNGPERYEGRTSPYGNARAWDREEYRREDRRNARRGSSRYDDRERGHYYPSARQNDWDDDMTEYRGFEETDYDDREVRRRRDEGMKPWDSARDDYDRDYDRRRYTDDNGGFRRRNDRRYEEDYGRFDYDRERPRGGRGNYQDRAGDRYANRPRRTEEDYDRDRDYNRYGHKEARGRRGRDWREDW